MSLEIAGNVLKTNCKANLPTSDGAMKTTYHFRMITLNLFHPTFSPTYEENDEYIKVTLILMDLNVVACSIGTNMNDIHV